MWHFSNDYCFSHFELLSISFSAWNKGQILFGARMPSATRVLSTSMLVATGPLQKKKNKVSFCVIIAHPCIAWSLVSYNTFSSHVKTIPAPNYLKFSNHLAQLNRECAVSRSIRTWSPQQQALARCPMSDRAFSRSNSQTEPDPASLCSDRCHQWRSCTASWEYRRTRRRKLRVQNTEKG